MSTLTTEEIAILRKQHRTEKNGDVRDRIKAVILRDKGWNEEKIAEALLVHVDTIKRHLIDYDDSQKLKSDAGGSTGKLQEPQVSA